MRIDPIATERHTLDAVLEALEDGGVRFVVGMPGGLTMALWSALENHPTIRPVQVREESLAAYMAESFGRLTGQPIVVMGQGEWITGNAGQGYLEALLGSSPIVILTEMSDGSAFSHHAPYQSGTGDYGTWDAERALSGMTKRVMVSHYPAQAVQHTQLALKHALTGDPGPVAVIFATDSLRGSVGPTTEPTIYPTSRYLTGRSRAIDHAAIEEVARAIRLAERPVVLAGNGVRVGQAWQNLEAVARAIDAPVVTTAGGKGVFPETDPLAGGVIGPFGWASANELLGNADLVLIVGSRLSSSDTAEGNPALLDPGRQVLIQADIEPLHTSWTVPMDHVLVGDASVLLDEICKVHGSVAPSRGSMASERIRHAARLLAPAAVGQPSAPFLARTTIDTIQASIPSETIVTCDAGENRLFMMQWFRSRGRGAYLQPAGGGGMGYAVPAAMGAKLAHPDHPVLAVCGDGGFSMSLHGLMSAVEQNLPIGVVVMNNSALGWVLHGSRNPVGAVLRDFDLAAIASSLGCDGVRVASLDELRDALRRLSGLSRPLVIDVPTSLETSFKTVLQTIDRQRSETGY
jgi:acetolactate synthase I/II/III large subunit